MTDAQRVAFDDKRVATLRASSESGETLAVGKTFLSRHSRNNYSLEVPVATAPVTGSAVVGQALAISVTDDEGRVWAGVVVDPGRDAGTVVGAPGKVREVDIVLMHDEDGDGFDDTLADQMRALWEDDRAWRDDADPDEEFDLDADYDGDGVSTRDEVFAGTDPFDEQSVLRIEAFDPAPEAEQAAGVGAYALSFPALGGHAYSLQRADSPNGPWSAVSFRTEAGAAPVSVLAYPNAERSSRPTVYLAPVEGDAAFFRVKVE